mgnify:CR=1 FL=1|tara:strand:+ start:352 stop:525 length:174 start_codon:yes stop_codon:yes gene_type:complete
MEKWEGILNFKKFNWGLTIPLITYWALVWYVGFFTTTIWSIIIAAAIGIWIRITGRG